MVLLGNFAAVGAPFEDGSATTVDGPDNDDATDAGAAYVYERNGATWDQKPLLKALNAGSDDRFGAAVAIHGEVAFVGAPFEDGNSEGLDGPGNDDGLDNGAVYGFLRAGDDWAPGVYLKAPNTRIQNQFGQSVAVSDRTLLVGTGLDDAPSRGVNADPTQDVDSNQDSGAAYVFHRAIPARAALSGRTRFPATRVRKRSRPSVLRVTNLGEAPLVGVAARSSGKARGDFRFAGPGIRTVAGGSATSLRAFFRPTKKGLRRATLTLSSNAAPLKRPLVGRGR